MDPIIGTIIAGLIVLAVVVGIVVKLCSDKKKGKSLCGGNCANCPGGCMCHSANNGSQKKSST